MSDKMISFNSFDAIDEAATQLGIHLERASVILRHVIADHFGFNCENPEEHWQILYDYDKNRVMTEVVSEELDTIKRMLGELNAALMKKAEEAAG